MAAIWAGLIALDFTGFGPWMLSQPLVCGPLFGWLMGQTAIGVIIGGIVQLLWMDLSPVGVGIPFDAMATTILAIFVASLTPDPSLSQLVWALIIAVPFGYVFRAADQYARRVNTHIMRRVEEVSDEHLPWALAGGILTGLLWSWVRYVAAYALAMALSWQIWNMIASVPRLSTLDFTIAILLLPVAGMGVALELFLSEEPEGRWVGRKSVPPAKKSS